MADEIRKAKSDVDQLRNSIRSLQKELGLTEAASARAFAAISRGAEQKRSTRQFRTSVENFGRRIQGGGSIHPERTLDVERLRISIKAFESEIDKLRGKTINLVTSQEDARRSIARLGTASNTTAQEISKGIKTTVAGAAPPVAGAVVGSDTSRFSRETIAFAERQLGEVDKLYKSQNRERVKGYQDWLREKDSLDRQASQKEFANLKRAIISRNDARIQGEKKFSETKIRDALQDVGAPELTERVISKAAEAGFKPEDLKNITDYANQFKKLNFVQKDGSGITRRYNLVVTKTGKILLSTQNQFRTFSSGLIRNYKEVLKWTIAVTAVYAPMQKLQELIEIAIKNEAELANVAIILGDSHQDLTAIFNNAAAAAAATGETISGVLEGYTLAYRATGDITDQSKRAAVSQQLLIDSLVLSKLSALDQAAALDTLAGALRQAGIELDKGGEFLNKWVSVTKIANVDMQTLAESFAITSTSAKNAGLSVDELNGVIATVAEVTTLSATEAGNAVRAFISGIQTNKAQEELSKLGIATKDVAGKARSIMDVWIDIRALSDAGLIDDSQLNKLASALGGGARRGAQYVSFLENLHRIQQIVTASTEDQSNAYDALGVKLDTVETKITELGNSFQIAAQRLGEEGGITDVLKSSLNISTALIDSLAILVQTFGKLTPLLALAGVTGLVGKFGGEGGLFGRFGGLAQVGAGLYQRFRPISAGGGGRAEANAFGKEFAARAPAIGASMGIGIMAVMNARQGEWAQVGGNLLGAAFGAQLAGPFGAIIGSVIGEAFVGLVESRGKDLGREFFIDPAKEAAEEFSKELTIEDLDKKLKESAGLFGTKFGGEFAIGLEVSLANFFIKAQNIVRGLEQPLIAPETIAYTRGSKLLNQEEFKEFQRLERRFNLENLSEDDEGGFKITTPFTEEIEKESKRNADILNSLIDEYTDKLSDSFNKQEINAKKYRDSVEFLQQGNSLITASFVILGDSFNSASEGYRFLTDTLTDSSKEQRDQIAVLMGEYNVLISRIEYLGNIGDKTVAGRITKEGRGDRPETSIINLKASTKDIQVQIGELFNAISQGIINQRTKLPAIIGAEELNLEQVNILIKEAIILQTEFFEHVGLTEDAIRAKTAAMADFVILTSEGYVTAGGFQQRFYSQALADAKKLGTISTSQFQIRQIDQPEAQFRAAYASTLAFLQQSFPQFEAKEIETGVIFSDGVAVLHLDNLVAQLAMQELIDVNRKQLDGIYNLPSGANFYVPAQALDFAYQAGLNAGAGGGGKTGLGAGALYEEDIITDGVSQAGRFGRRPELGEAGRERRLRHGRQQREEIRPDDLEKDRWRKAVPFPKAPIRDETFIDKLKTFFESFGDFELPEPYQIPTQAAPIAPPAWDSLLDQFKSFFDNLSVEGLTSNLNLSLTSTIQLVVDGQTLATAVLPFLYEDILRYEGTGGTINKNILL